MTPESAPLASRAQDVIIEATSLYNVVKSVATDRQMTELELDIAESNYAIFERRATLAYDLNQAVGAYDEALLVSAVHLNDNLSTYVQQAAAFALEEGVRINL